MRNLTGGGQIVAGIILIILGLLVQSGLFQFLLNIIGAILVIGGIIVAVLGLIAVFRGGGRRSYGDY